MAVAGSTCTTDSPAKVKVSPLAWAQAAKSADSCCTAVVACASVSRLVSIDQVTGVSQASASRVDWACASGVVGGVGVIT